MNLKPHPSPFHKFLEQVERKRKRVDRLLRKRSLLEVLRAVKEARAVAEEDILSRGRSKVALFTRGILLWVWREMGCRLVDLQPCLSGDLSVLSRMSKIAENGEGWQAMGQVSEMLSPAKDGSTPHRNTDPLIGFL